MADGGPRVAVQSLDACSFMAERNIDNVVRDVFCEDDAPPISSLVDLQRALDLGCPDLAADTPWDYDPAVGRLPGHQFPDDYAYPFDDCGAFALSFLSSSLVMKQVSPLNPRAIIFREDDEAGSLFMAFTRGDHFVELIAEDRNTLVETPDGVRAQINFFLVRFEQACTTDDSCTNADLYTDRIESNWTDYTLLSEHELRNTPADCLQCHESGGPDGPSFRSLLFHEIERPWPHMMQTVGFDLVDNPPFFDDFESELDNKLAFLEANPVGTRFAGIPVSGVVNYSSPQLLEGAMVRRGLGDGFDPSSKSVDPDDSSRFRRYTLDELQALNEDGAIIQFPTQRSGELMDPDKKATALASIAAFRAGEADDIVSLADVFPDGHEAEYERLSLRVKPGASGAEIIRQACTQCHNPRRDQTISRARFDALLLEEMSVDALRLAQERITLDVDDEAVMPPTRFRTLDAAERDRAVAYLQTLIDGR